MYKLKEYWDVMDSLVEANKAFHSNKLLMTDERYETLISNCYQYECKHPELARKDSISIKRHTTKYLQDISKIVEAEKAYRAGTPIMSDNEFDFLVRSCKRYESIMARQSAILKTNVEKATALQDDNGEVEHPTRMWSQPNVVDKNGIKVFVNRMVKLAMRNSLSNIEFIIEPKYDGLSINLVYKDGKLVDAITRGTGFKGTSVMDKIPYITGIPLELDGKHTGLYEIRGELVISKANLVVINAQRLKDGLPIFSNTRNLVAASVSALKDLEEFKTRNVEFRYWSMNIPNHNTSVYEKTLFLQSYSKEFKSHEFMSTHVEPLKENNDSVITAVTEHLYNLIQYFKNDIEISDIDMDGVIIKLDNISLYNQITPSNKYENVSIAYKYNDKSADTKVNSITHAVSRFGRLTPVALLEPASVDGVLVSRVNLSNYSLIKTIDLKINDRVKVIRSGDVVPKITEVYTNLRDDSVVDIITPTSCPICSSDLMLVSKDMYCSNNDCIGRLKAYFTYVVSKEALNIKGMSSAMIDKIIDKEIDLSLLDFLNIEMTKLGTIQGINYIDVYDKIHNHKITDFYRLLLCLNIPGLGESQAKVLSTLMDHKPCTNIMDLYDKDVTIKKSVSLDKVVEILNTNESEQLLDRLYKILM